MKTRNLLIAAAVLLLLSAGVWWAKKHPADTGASTTPASPKVADIAPNQVQQVDVTKRGSPPTVLQRQGDKWVIVAPAPFAADQSTVSSMLSALNPLTSDNVVDESGSDPSKYGLTTPSLTVSVRQKSGKTTQIAFGDDVPAGSLVYARVNSDRKIYAVTSSNKSSFDKTLADLRDKRLLTFDPSKLTQVELASAKNDLVFGKNGTGDWQIIKPQPYRADSFAVEELVRKLGDAKMDLSVSPEDQKKADALFASGQRVATARLTSASGAQTLDVRKNKDDYYAKSSVAEGDTKISADLGKELEKGVDDFRNRKIFDFGFNDPTRIEIDQSTYVRSGTDWKSGGKTMDPGSVQSLIDKLRELSANAFVTSGFTNPVNTITVISNEGKRTEKVEFSKSAAGYIARRNGEPTLYQLDTKSVDDILSANKQVKPAASGKQ